MDSSYSSSSRYTNTVASSSFSSIPQGKNGPKKKKKAKSSVAIIADSLDDGVGVMNSVEKYLYNMSDSHENSKTETLDETLDVQTSQQRDEPLSLSHQAKIPNEREIVNNFQNDSHSTRESEDSEEISGHIQTEQLLSHEENLSKTEDGLEDIQHLSYPKEDCTRTDETRENLELGENELCLDEDNNRKFSELGSDFYEEDDPVNDNDLQKEKCTETDSPSNDKTFQEQDEKPDNEFDYQVSRAHFKYGTPTEQSLDDSKEESLSPEDDEDFNFVPGIHKPDPWRSHSGSFSSLTGSGSFNAQSKPETEEPRRPSTSVSKSSVLNDSWRYVTNTLAGIERKDSRADNMSVATEDSLGDLAMFEELLGMSEDHFASPEVSISYFL